MAKSRKLRTEGFLSSKPLPTPEEVNKVISEVTGQTTPEPSPPVKKEIAKVKEVKVEKRENRYGSHYYTVHGPLFFGSTASFSEQFTPKDDNNDVIIDFADSRVVDHSGIEAIDALAMRYRKNNRTLHLIHLSPECKKLLKKAGDMVEVNVVEDPDYFVAIESAFGEGDAAS